MKKTAPDVLFVRKRRALTKARALRLDSLAIGASLAFVEQNENMMQNVQKHMRDKGKKFSRSKTEGGYILTRVV